MYKFHYIPLHFWFHPDISTLYKYNNSPMCWKGKIKIALAGFVNLCIVFSLPLFLLLKPGMLKLGQFLFAIE